MRYGADPSGIATASPAHHGRWIRLGAAMAAITFDTAHQSETFELDLENNGNPLVTSFDLKRSPTRPKGVAPPFRTTRSEGLFDMTMLTHTRGPFEPPPYTSERRDAVRANSANARMAAIKHFCLCALMALMAVGAVGGLIALKTAAYFWRFHN
jgi:hypothetical protein